MNNVFHYRDLVFSKIPGGNIVVAADSCASTGRKPDDALQVSPEHVGAVSARVVMLELFCVGAEVRVIADGVCAEMDPTGLGIIRGFFSEMDRAGISREILTGSTEDNFPTAMTGVGTAGIGYVPGNFAPPKAHAGDFVCALGEPLVGAAVLQKKDAKIADYDDVRTLRANPDVSEMVPVGSHGVRWETEGIAKRQHLKAVFSADLPFDLEQSGGPSTCVLAVMPPSAYEQNKKALPLSLAARLV